MSASPVQLDWLAEGSLSRVVTHPPAPRARRADPATSHAAAAIAATFVAGHEAKVFGAICDAGELGATAKEIAKSTGLSDVQVNRRLGAMGKRGLIERRFTPREERIDPMCFDYQKRGVCCIWWVKP